MNPVAAMELPVNTLLIGRGSRGIGLAVPFVSPGRYVMERKALTETLSIGPQITPDDIAVLKEAGFRAIICNRPDGESPDQPSHEEMRLAAHAAGLEFRYLPVMPGAVTDERAVEFGQAIGELLGPVFAYCRTGNRSANLWLLAEANRRSTVSGPSAT